MEPAIPGLIALALLLLVSGFLTSAREALSNAHRPALRELAEKGSRRALLAVTIAEDSSRVLGTFHLANRLAHFLVASFVITVFLPPLARALTARLNLLIAVSDGISFVFITLITALLVYIVTDLLPEILVHPDPDRWAMRLARPAQITLILLAPLVWLLARIRRLIAAPLSDSDSDVQITEEEIMTMVDAGEEEGSIQLGEKEMIYSIFQLDDTVAREIMIPRIDIIALEINTPLEEAREVILQAGHSRIPIYEESLDQVLGLLYAKDLLRLWHEGKTSLDLRSLLRPPVFVPESKRVPDLLSQLQTAKVHLAIVVDEFGGTAGLVTLEDIVEEIVGEIQDEYDGPEEAQYETIGEDEYIIDARMNLDDLNDLLDTRLSDEDGDTLGGFIYAELGKVPHEGEKIKTSTLCLEVLKVEDRRIRKVRVTRLVEEKPPAPTQNGKDQHTNGTTSNH